MTFPFLLIGIILACLKELSADKALSGKYLSTIEGIPSQPALNFLGVLEIMREILKVEIGKKTLKKDLENIINC